MFGSAQKTKSLAQVLRETNSRSRFVNELSKNEEYHLNRSLDSGQTAPLEKKPNLKQSKLCIRRSLKRSHELNNSFRTSSKMESTIDLFIIPSPKMKVLESSSKLNNTISANVNTLQRPSCSTTNNKECHKNLESAITCDLMQRPGRNMLMLVGKVDYVLKISKLYPKINVLWDVYGKLQKISKGKNRYECILLLRNIAGDGPVLQGIYYDFDDTLSCYKHDSNVRVVGNMKGPNRLRIFKIQVLENIINQSSLMRIQNINSLVLLQNQATTRK